MGEVEGRSEVRGSAWHFVINISVLLVVVLNLVLTAYHYGQLEQKVTDLQVRVSRLERVIDHEYEFGMPVPLHPKYSQQSLEVE